MALKESCQKVKILDFSRYRPKFLDDYSDYPVDLVIKGVGIITPYTAQIACALNDSVSDVIAAHQSELGRGILKGRTHVPLSTRLND